jgi:hypothetical protein
MTAVIANIGRLRDDAGVHALLVHHTPRDNPRASRGHSAVDGAVDLIIGVGRSGEHHRWRVLSANALPEPFPAGEFDIRSAQIGDASVAIVWPAEPELTGRDGAVFDAIKAAAPGSVIVAELTRSLEHQTFAGLAGDARRKAVDRSLRALVDMGLATIAGEGRQRTVRSAA